MTTTAVNTEIEAKFFVCAEGQTFEETFGLLDKLYDLGFVQTASLDQKDTYFQHTIKLGLTEHSKTYLRVRTNDGVSSTAMHYKQSDYKWTEIETGVADGDKLRLMYQNLGMAIDIEVHKLRQVFKSDSAPNVEIVFDHLVGVGYFLEIEAPSLEVLWQYANALGLTQEQADLIKDKSYADLVKESK